jgi:hypothetical protein
VLRGCCLFGRIVVLNAVRSQRQRQNGRYQLMKRPPARQDCEMTDSR